MGKNENIRDDVLRAFNIVKNVSIAPLKRKDGTVGLYIDAAQLENEILSRLTQETPSLHFARDVSDIKLKDYVSMTSDIVLKDLLRSIEIAFMMKGATKMDPVVANVLGLNKKETPKESPQVPVEPVSQPPIEPTPVEPVSQPQVVESQSINNSIKATDELDDLSEFDDDEEIVVSN